jgi:histidinol phosphatase-like PHP family hydrolase
MGNMKVDLHVHTLERSPCAKASEDEQLQAASKAGLDALFITDHWALVPAKRLSELNRRYAPLRIFGGIEVSADGEDLLVLGVQDARLETQAWTYPELHAFVRRRGGFLILAHPFRYRPGISIDIQSYPPDAIELFTPNTPVHAQDEIRTIARSLSLPVLSNSDAHTTERLGLHYNLLAGHDLGEPGIFNQLRAGKFELFCKNHTLHPALADK